MPDGSYNPYDNTIRQQGDMPHQNSENDYDSNFDAGIDTNEEEDPRTYIQQLTGKLSQSLRKYNDERSRPDSDLCKYVAGMINKQASKGLSEKDVDEILDKIRSNEDFDMEDDKEGEDTDRRKNRQEEMGDDGMTKESVRKKRTLDELFNDMINQRDSERHQKKISRKSNDFRKKPFTSPAFE